MISSNSQIRKNRRYMMRKDGKIIKRSGILYSGKTVEKSLEKALAELNASIDEVEIEIVDAG